MIVIWFCLIKKGNEEAIGDTEIKEGKRKKGRRGGKEKRKEKEDEMGEVEKP